VLPDTVNGLPLHALAVHATVVLVPLLALLGVMYAVPALRGWARWPLGLGAVGAALSTWVSMQSGGALKEALEARGSVAGAWADAIDRHAELAGQLQWMVYAYAAIAVVAIFVVRPSGPADTRAAGARDPAGVASARGAAAVAMVMSVVLVLGAVAVGVQVARVGDAGAKAVWNPDGKADFSAD
jgi:hypothetical protein